LAVRFQSQAVLTQNEDAEAQLVHIRKNNCPPGWPLWISTRMGACIYMKTWVTFTCYGPRLWLV